MELLFIFIILYVNIVRYFELREYTTVNSFKMYIKIGGYTTILYNITLLLIFIICEVVIYFRHH